MKILDIGPADVPFIRRHRNFFVGLFMTTPLIIIPVLLGYTLMKAEFLQGWCRLYVLSDNSYGLTKGNPVTVSGITVGYVREVELVREGVVKVVFTIKRRYKSLIRKDTRCRFQQKNMLVGDWTIELTGGSPQAAVIEEDDTLQTIETVRLEHTVTQITNMISTFENIIRDVSEGKGTVGRLLKEDILLKVAQEVGLSVGQVLSAARSSMAGIDTLIKEMTTAGRGGSGFIDSLQSILIQVKASLEDASVILKNLRNASEDVEPLMREVKDDIAEADMMIRSLKRSWIYRRIAGEGADCLLKDVP